MLILCADWWLDGMVVADIGTPWENCNRSEHAVNVTTLMTQKIDKEWTFICDIWNVADILVLFTLSTKKQTELHAGDWSTIPVVPKSHYLTWQWFIIFFFLYFPEKYYKYYKSKYKEKCLTLQPATLDAFWYYLLLFFILFFSQWSL